MSGIILLWKLNIPSKKEMKKIKMRIFDEKQTKKKNAKKVYVYQYKVVFLSLL